MWTLASKSVSIVIGLFATLQFCHADAATLVRTEINGKAGEKFVVFTSDGKVNVGIIFDDMPEGSALVRVELWDESAKMIRRAEYRAGRPAGSFPVLDGPLLRLEVEFAADATFGVTLRRGGLL